ncbi:MAG TPA: PspC domain-containing protein [Anaerolineae bacterium]|nr:PspC domain-containing protein [Anaerolineae bacterium]
MSKRLHRSRSDRMVASVCGGLGTFLNIDPTLIRLALVVLTFASGFIPVMVGYLLAWFIIPEEP